MNQDTPALGAATEATSHADIVTNESAAAAAFSVQSSVFDDLYGPDEIIQYKRNRVRQHVEQFLQPHSHILELNCGTGEDAFYFARQGHDVNATDYAPGMLARLEQKLRIAATGGAVTSTGKVSVSAELCSFTELGHLRNKGPYDLIFSNFAGLNCTGNLDKVFAEFEHLLKPGGLVTLVILPPFCLWETLLMFKGKGKTAFRRWFSRKGRVAKVEGLPFRCWYYSPRIIERLLGPSFETLDIEGLCTIVPPSYIEGFALSHPLTFQQLCRWENKSSRAWPWKYIGDYYIITLKKRS